MHKTHRNTLFLLISLIFIAACQNYSLSVNQKQVYNPSAIFTDFRLADKALQRCVDGIIAENLLKKAEQVTQIVCGPKGIANIAGLELFTQLQHLGLASNAIENIDTLSQLKQLRRLHLANNPIKDIQPLLELENLEYMNLEGIENLACHQISILKQARSGLIIELPEHCNMAKATP